MKIGIITYHRAHNYGAVLQAYALKSYLTEEGHNVEIIDYWPDYRIGMYDLIDLRFLHSKRGFASTLKSACKSILKLPVAFPTKKRRFDKFQAFITSELVNKKNKPISTGVALPEYHDLYVYGSDQIWRYNNFINYAGFDEVYWGEYPKVTKAKKITYAASMGVLKNTPQTNEYLLSKVDNFSSISVRERSLGDWIQTVTGREIKKVLDPAFLLDAESWCDVAASDFFTPKKYVLLYNLNKSKIAEELAYEISIKYECEVVLIDGSIKPFSFSKNYQSTVGPREFLSLFKNASYIVSSSFHGVVFSIIFQKQFYSLGIGENSSRVTELLHELGIPERYLSKYNEAKLDSLIDYEAVTFILNKMKQESKAYLNSQILK